MTKRESIQGLWKALSSGLGAVLRGLGNLLGSGLRRTGQAASDPRLRARLRPMSRLARGAALGLLLASGVWIAGASILERVPPGMLAVEQINWGENAGIVNQDRGPGLHLAWGGRSTWHRIPGGTQFVNFGWENIGGTEPMLAVAIQGGVPAEVNVCIPYRIQPGQAWRIVQAGLKNDYPRRVTAIARRVLLEELGQLSTDDFASSDARARVEQLALERLNVDLDQVHLEALEVVIGAVYFDPSFENKLHEKQLATQTELTNRSLAARKAADLQREFSLHEVAAEQRALAAQWDMQIAQAKIGLERELHALERAGQEYPQQVAAAGAVNEAEFKAEGQRRLNAAQALTQAVAHPGTESAGSRDPLVIAHRQASHSLAQANQEFQQADAALEAEFSALRLAERLAHEQELKALERESLATVRQLQSEADSERDRLMAQGELVLVRARALSERLHNEILESTGGRLYLAQQAAQNLRIERVVLDPSDPSVPNILDLDELLALLVGSQQP
jgi:hypothetical protein